MAVGCQARGKSLHFAEVSCLHGGAMLTRNRSGRSLSKGPALSGGTERIQILTGTSWKAKGNKEAPISCAKQLTQFVRDNLVKVSFNSWFRRFRAGIGAFAALTIGFANLDNPVSSHVLKKEKVPRELGRNGSWLLTIPVHRGCQNNQPKENMITNAKKGAICRH